MLEIIKTNLQQLKIHDASLAKKVSFNLALYIRSTKLIH